MFAALFCVYCATSASPREHLQDISPLPPGHRRQVQPLDWQGNASLKLEICLPVWELWEVSSSANGDGGCTCRDRPSIAQGSWPTVTHKALLSPLDMQWEQQTIVVSCWCLENVCYYSITQHVTGPFGTSGQSPCTIKSECHVGQSGGNKGVLPLFKIE